MNVTFAFWWWSELRLMLCFWGVNQNSWLEGSKQNYWSFNMFLRQNVNYGGWSIIFKNCITKCDETILVCVCPVDSVHYWVTCACVLAGKSTDQWVLCPLQWSPACSPTGRQSSGNSPPWTLDPGQWAAAPLDISPSTEKAGQLHYNKTTQSFTTHVPRVYASSIKSKFANNCCKLPPPSHRKIDNKFETFIIRLTS